MMQILDDATRRAIAYLASLQHRPVSPRADNINRLNTTGAAKVDPADEVLSRLDEFDGSVAQGVDRAVGIEKGAFG